MHLKTSYDENLLRATIKLNTVLAAAVSGFVGGMTLMALTYFSLLGSSPEGGHLLNLLGVFLPGYAVSGEGLLIGFVWGSVLGGFLGSAIYLVYARSIPLKVKEYLTEDPSLLDLDYGIISLNVNFLGLALASMAALGLFVTTNILVLRGTADGSIHAALLSQYLPGYAVSFTGSLVGAVDVFVFAYLFGSLFGFIYNKTVTTRQRKVR